MYLKSGSPYSLIKYGLLYDYPKLEEPIETEVVILGGGISGALIAFKLVEAGIDVVVFDSRTIGLGSTCASTSLLQYEIDIPLHRLKKMIGEKSAVRSYQLCSEAINKLGIIAEKIGFKEYNFRKSIYFAATNKDKDSLKKEYTDRKEAGFEVSFLEQKDLYDNFGFKAPAAIVSELAAEADAYKFTHFIHQYNLSKGSRVFDRSEVIEIKQKKNGLQLKTVNGSNIKAKHIIYATGYEVTELLKENFVTLKTTYASITEPFANDKQFWPERAIIWNTANPYLYIRTTKDNRIIIGGRDDNTFNKDISNKLLARKSKQLKNDFNRIFPEIEFIPEFTWAGVFGSTKDGLPYIGQHKKHPKSYFSLGFGGNGITFSLIGAEVIADLIREKKNKDQKLFSFER